MSIYSCGRANQSKNGTFKHQSLSWGLQKILHHCGRGRGSRLSICPTQPIFTNTESAMLSTRRGRRGGRRRSCQEDGAGNTSRLSLSALHAFLNFLVVIGAIQRPVSYFSSQGRDSQGFSIVAPTGFFFNWSARFSVQRRKTCCSQPRLVFHEIFNVKMLHVGWATFFILVLRTS